MRLQLCDRLDDVPAVQWDALHAGTNPFVSHDFLVGLERNGCLRPSWGWSPRHALLYHDDTLVAAAPGYRKDNSHGEFVFDHAWAEAYERHGFAYYPKWLVGVPYSPVPGPRLLGCSIETRRTLALGLAEQTRQQRWSSTHINFLDEDDAVALGEDWIERYDIQFHWRQPEDSERWRDFADFLDAMSHKRRKAIRQERDKVGRAGFSFRVVSGAEATEHELQAMHAFYASTFAIKGNSPALTPGFFTHLAQTFPAGLVMVFAELGREIVAGALFMRGGDTLYGRYWGSTREVPGLHFETCYYQGIDYCLREGLRRFEPGAQGEHKLARGFLPTLTTSRHFIRDPDFAQAIRSWCASERDSVMRYRDHLLQHSPFRHADPTPATRS